MYEFLTGMLPFGNASPTCDSLSVFQDIHSKSSLSGGELIFPDHLRDDAAKDLILRLLIFDPD